MNKELCVLIIEDVPTDAELLKYELSEAGIPFISRCVAARSSFLKALDDFCPDLILSDYSLPSFNGLSALKIAREKCPEVPFIFVSGALGEELAIELLKQGATDYVLKNRLSRLVPAVCRALQEVEERNERRVAEEALKQREQALELKSRSLEEANTALKVLLKHREEDKATIEEQVQANVRKLVFPYIENLKRLKLNDNQMSQVRMIEANLQEIVSPFLRNLTSAYLCLTPREIQVANLVKDGRTTKEMTDILNISATAIDFHRKNLRSKLGIKNKRNNLRSYISSIS
ncbi:MAG: response regulator [Syntrophales bacterium]|jgi:DNA-binding NarL/FixJ family response regulator|nr:response regulator [Syntrophales bacterium]MCK9390650.1 response regulator [Syntrophales bacterium]